MKFQIFHENVHCVATGSPMVLLSLLAGRIQVEIKDQISQIVPLFEYFNEENVNFDL